MQNREWHLSATCIGCFKACPMRYFYRYILGLKPIAESDALRMGSNWHSILEIYNAPIYQDETTELRNEAVLIHLNEVYADVPTGKTADEWEVEKLTLFYSLLGYNWYYSAQEQYPVLEQEVEFKQQLTSPITGHILPGVFVVGKIDKIIGLYGGGRAITEHKSTGKSIDQDSTFWKHLNLDTQTRLYPFVRPDVSGVFYDVWHKPQISPRKLSKADLNKIQETGRYYDQEVPPVQGERETPEMFGARLLDDICTRPEFYFARREIARTQADLEAFHWELFNIYQTIRQMNKTGRWWRNEQNCESTFKCDYIGLCYNNVNVGPDDVPEGFKK